MSYLKIEKEEEIYYGGAKFFRGFFCDDLCCMLSSHSTNKFKGKKVKLSLGIIKRL
jgi:hypothetical protein